MTIVYRKFIRFLFAFSLMLPLIHSSTAFAVPVDLFKADYPEYIIYPFESESFYAAYHQPTELMDSVKENITEYWNAKEKELDLQIDRVYSDLVAEFQGELINLYQQGEKITPSELNAIGNKFVEKINQSRDRAESYVGQVRLNSIALYSKEMKKHHRSISEWDWQVQEVIRNNFDSHSAKFDAAKDKEIAARYELLEAYWLETIFWFLP